MTETPSDIYDKIERLSKRPDGKPYRGSKRGRPFRHNTLAWVSNVGGGWPPRAIVRFHDTDIVRATPTTVEYFHGEWTTVTTADRLRDFLPAGVHLLQQGEARKAGLTSEWGLSLWRPGFFPLVMPFHGGEMLRYDHDMALWCPVDEVEDLRPAAVHKALLRWVRAFTPERQLHWNGTELPFCADCVNGRFDPGHIAMAHGRRRRDRQDYHALIVTNALAAQGIECAPRHWQKVPASIVRRSLRALIDEVDPTAIVAKYDADYKASREARESEAA